MNDICLDKKGNTYVLFRLNNFSSKKIIASADGRNYTTDRNSGVLIAKYSRNGVLLWVHALESITNPNCPFQNPVLSAGALAVDEEGSLFLSIGVSVITDCAELLFTNYQGDTQLLDLSGNLRYFVAKINADAGVVQWIKSYNHSSFHFAPIQIEPDGQGGCYSWDRDVNSNTAARLLHLSSSGEHLWAMAIFTDIDLYGNEISVDQWGNVLVVSTLFGELQISGNIKFELDLFKYQSVMGNVLLKLGPDGALKWGRYLFSGHSEISNTSHASMGVDSDGDKIYTITQVSGFNDFITGNACSYTSIPGQSLYLSVWDSLGNLIEVKTMGTNFNSSSNGGIFQTIKVQNGVLYTTNVNTQAPANAVLDYPVEPQPPNHQYYFARVPDPKDYQPYITTPELYSFNLCTFNSCLNDSTKVIQVSYLFDSIRWHHNGNLLAGYNTPAIVPPLVGNYEVTAVNTKGETVYTPKPMEVLSVVPLLHPVIFQSGDTLKTQLFPDAYYIWRDSTGEIFHISDDNDTIYIPGHPGLWQVEVVLNDLHCNIVSPYFFYQAVPVSEAEGESFSLKVMPNPLQTETTISYHIPGNAPVRLSVCDILGKECAVLLETEQGASGTLQFKPGQYHLTSGIYF